MNAKLSLPVGKSWLFVSGMDRGGTTITTQVLNTHPEVSVDLERGVIVRCRDLVDEIRRNQIFPCGPEPLPAVREGLETLAPLWERKLQEGVYEYYGARQHRYVGDKIPWYIDRLAYLREAYPGARFLLNWREPLGTLASWRRMWWRRHLSLQEQIAAYNAVVAAIRESARREDTLVIRHERLQREPRTVFAEVARFLELADSFDVSGVERRRRRPLPRLDQAYIRKHAEPL